MLLRTVSLAVLYFVVIIQLFVQFTCTCMLKTNHCHKTPIPWIPTAQTLDNEIKCQSSDNQLEILRSGRFGRNRGLTSSQAPLDVGI
jgi:hypothetical protein